MKRYFLFVLTFLLATVLVTGRSSIVEIGLLTSAKPTTIIITPTSGDYSVVSNDSVIYTLQKEDLLHITLKGQELELKTLNGLLGNFASIRLVPPSEGGFFKLKPVVPSGQTRSYDDILFVSISGEKLQIINEVHIDKYVAGVVRSEVGTNEGLELYKVQAIICRTYALSSFRKHEEEDYQLCDKVHCQVFAGSCTQADPFTGLTYAASEVILQASLATTGLILVDTTLELITASFHSNCGGQTANSEEVWMLSKPYLRSIKDPYCINRRNARWVRNVSTDKWLGYFRRAHGYQEGDNTSKDQILNFAQTSRKTYFQNNRKIMLKDVRKDWRFRSAFFSTTQMGDEVVVQGRGFGHGVGLCQEGSMEMAVQGIDYKEILHFYYTNVSLIDIETLRFLLK